MAAKSISLEIRLRLQSKLFDLGDFSGPKESHPMRHVPMANMLLELKDEAEIAKKENLLIRQAALTKLLEEDNRVLDESIKKIMSADENIDEEL